MLGLVALVPARWEAFAQAYREEMSIEPETVLRAYWPGALCIVERFRTAMEATAYADDSQVREAGTAWHETAADVWRCYRSTADPGGGR